MSWFVKKITDLEETFQQLISIDIKESAKAKERFVAYISYDIIDFLIHCFKTNDDQRIRLLILDIFEQVKDILDTEALGKIMPLISYEDLLIRKSFKNILSAINDNNLAAVTAYLAKTKSEDEKSLIHAIVQASGILEKILSRWKEYNSKEKIIHLDEIIFFKSDEVYAIFQEIIKEETLEEVKEKKRVLQVKFLKYLPQILDKRFMTETIQAFDLIDTTLRAPIFSSFKKFGNEFYDLLFDKFLLRNEQQKHLIMKLVEQLADINSYPYVFSYLQEPNPSVAQSAANIISRIVRNYRDDADSNKNFDINEPGELENLHFLTRPIEENLSKQNFTGSKLFTECLLILGHFDRDIILRNFAKIYQHNKTYLTSFLSGLPIEERKLLLIEGAKYPDILTVETVLEILSDPSEKYIIDTLNTIMLDHFKFLSRDTQKSFINLLLQPNLSKFIKEVLYHQDTELRATIINILAESDTQTARDLIKEKRQDAATSVREAIVKAVISGKFPEDYSLETSLAMITDPAPSVAVPLLKALGKSDHPEIIMNVSPLLNAENPEIKTAASRAVLEITKRKYLAGFNKMPEEAKLKVGIYLVHALPDFMEEITEQLTSADLNKRVKAAQILEVLHEYMTPELKTNLIVSIKDSDPRVRAVVIMGLGKIGGPSVADLLSSFLADEDSRVRANAVEALGNLADYTYIERILPTLEDSNNRVRANAIITLRKLGYTDIFKEIAAMLTDQDPWMRASAVYALGELGEPIYFQTLLQAARDKSPDVRRNVVKALGKIVDPNLLAFYIKPMRFDPDESVRNEVANLLKPKKKAKLQ